MQTAMTNLSNSDKRFWVHLISTYVISWYVYKVSFSMFDSFWSYLVHVCYKRLQHDRCMIRNKQVGYSTASVGMHPGIIALIACCSDSLLQVHLPDSVVSTDKSTTQVASLPRQI